MAEDDHSLIEEELSFFEWDPVQGKSAVSETSTESVLCRFVFYRVKECFFELAEIFPAKVDDPSDWCRDKWWFLVESGRVGDVEVLHHLVRIAERDERPEPISLEQISEDALGAAVEEDAELNPTPFAVAQTAVILKTYQMLVKMGHAYLDPYKHELMRNAEQRFGLLSETVQVKASIVFHRLNHQPIEFDAELAEQLRLRIHSEIEEKINKMRSDPRFDIFTYEDDGTLVRTESGSKPYVKTERLQEALELAVDEAIVEKWGRDLAAPMNADGTYSVSSWLWKKFMPMHWFIQTWVDFERDCRLESWLLSTLEIVQRSKVERDGKTVEIATVTPQYNYLVRNGRTATSSPNIQATPKAAGFRELYMPSPGHVFLTVDYKYIELCTLAAICESRFRFSVLAQVIRKGVDPHSYTASIMEGVSLMTFMRMKKSPDKAVRQKFAKLRQNCKAINFGIPSGGGLDAVANYGAEMTFSEMKAMKQRLITEVYPELKPYLMEGSVLNLARNLRVHVSYCWETFREPGMRKSLSLAIIRAARNVVAGVLVKPKSGEPFKQKFVDGVWQKLNQLNCNPELAEILQARVGSPEVEERIFGSTSITLTGRMRRGIGFTKAHNTPFSGLAADGAKLALWNLLQIGYKVVAFIHDEVIIELPEDADFSAEARIVNRVMCKAMGSVTPRLPIRTQYAVSRRWSKEAIATKDSEGRLVIWEDFDPEAEYPGIEKHRKTTKPGGVTEVEGEEEEEEEQPVSVPLVVDPWKEYESSSTEIAADANTAAYLETLRAF